MCYYAYVIKRKEHTMANKNNGSKPAKPAKKRISYNVVGLLQIFVVVSIAYSTYIVALGTEGYAPKVMLIPQTLYAALLFVNKFSK
jgi:hypothetical protein